MRPCFRRDDREGEVMARGGDEEDYAVTASAKFAVGLSVNDTADGWQATFEYRTDLFDESTIRQMARHYGRHIPGNPNIIVQNMPGAASMTSVRYLDATAPKDGTVVTTFDVPVVDSLLAAFHAEHRPAGPGRENPFVQPGAADAERVALALLRSRPVTVDGDGEVVHT